ncbi:hypothetical protein A0U92_03495 [Acetobacter aceti]|uniref:Uncharacterized protein n=1 Tax=Acetobacter aceti TaxID=435 RepID=A0A1U9KDU8_ACEAC|nr:hypothetical protein [Acetobacter aceti]AQS83985.1 hypothetical protein A0U92_03495 [Acetobacter aceti]
MSRFNKKQQQILRLARLEGGAPYIYKTDIKSLLDAGLIEGSVSGLGGHQIRYFATDAGMQIDAAEIVA